jgi:hypothetical protein
MCKDQRWPAHDQAIHEQQTCDSAKRRNEQGHQHGYSAVWECERPGASSAKDSGNRQQDEQDASDLHFRGIKNVWLSRVGENRLLRRLAEGAGGVTALQLQ